MVLFLNIVLVLGVLFKPLAIPGLSVGLMQAARNIERGQPVGIQTLYGSLREKRPYADCPRRPRLCCTLGALALSALVDGGALLNSCRRTAAPSEPWSKMPTSRCRQCSSCWR